jgi:hypothetical protein
LQHAERDALDKAVRGFQISSPHPANPAQKNTPCEMQNGSGVTATACGLLFHGNMQALDATIGDILWQFQTGANETGPAAIYEVDGEEYVADFTYIHKDHPWAFGQVNVQRAGAFPGLRRGRDAGHHRWRARRTRAAVLNKESQ